MSRLTFGQTPVVILAAQHSARAVCLLDVLQTLCDPKFGPNPTHIPWRLPWALTRYRLSFYCRVEKEDTSHRKENSTRCAGILLHTTADCSAPCLQSVPFPY